MGLGNCEQARDCVGICGPTGAYGTLGRGARILYRKAQGKGYVYVFVCSCYGNTGMFLAPIK